MAPVQGFVLTQTGTIHVLSDRIDVPGSPQRPEGGLPCEVKSRTVYLRGHNASPYVPMCSAPVKKGIYLPYYKLEVRLGQKICMKCAMQAFYENVPIRSRYV